MNMGALLVHGSLTPLRSIGASMILCSIFVLFLLMILYFAKRITAANTSLKRTYITFPVVLMLFTGGVFCLVLERLLSYALQYWKFGFEGANSFISGDSLNQFYMASVVSLLICVAALNRDMKNKLVFSSLVLNVLSIAIVSLITS